MKLLKIRLVNIRTYVDCELSFDSGITLLSGDIGSGKSSILLAVEFALFGSSRADLPAEALLRKGESKASVELWFNVDGKEVAIKRNLSLQKAGIRQGNGYLIINGVRRDLTPVELKAEIVGLLGYPEDLAGRGKNYVYKYTVYCPQEEMKHILQENAENRLDILRKLFGVEKYKLVRDNLQIYLKDMRREKIVLETRLEPFMDKVESKLRLESEHKELKIKCEGVLGLKDKASLELGTCKDKFESLVLLRDKKEKLNLEIKISEEKKIGLLDRKAKLEFSLREVLEELEGLFLSSEMDSLKISEEILRLEGEIRKFMESKIKIESEISLVAAQLGTVKKEMQEINFDEEKFFLSESRLKEINSLDLDILGLEKRREELLVQEKTVLALKQTALSKADLLRENLDKVLGLGECSLCLQEVGLSHKEHIGKIEREKILKLETDLRESVLQEERSVFNLRESGLAIDKVRLLIDEKKSLEGSLVLMGERRLRLVALKETLKETIVKNNSLMGKLGELNNEEKITLPRMQKRVADLRAVQKKIEVKAQLLKQKNAFESEKSQLIVKIDNVVLEISNLKEQESLIEVSTSLIDSLKIKLEHLRTVYEKRAVEYAEIGAKFEHMSIDLKNLILEITELEKIKADLIWLSEQLHWLSSYFISLTYTIEKEIMLKIYYRFNELFVYWFSSLVEGGEVTARLDQSFTPVISQNGHEISFAYLSGGERTAASLAYRLSLNKVINDVVHEIKTKDLLMLDEPTDGFSSEQLDRLRDVLEKLGLAQIIIVSHEPNVEGFVNRVVRVEKTAGKSRIVS